MPKRSSFQNAFWNKEDFNYWYISLQPCEISESELKKIKMALPPDYSKPIDVTDIVDATSKCGAYRCYSECIECKEQIDVITFKSPLKTNGVVTFKQQEETNEEVYGYVAIHNNKIISGIYTHYHRIDEDYPNSNIYEIFKSKKFKN